MSAMISVTLKEAIRKKTFVVMSILAALYLILWTVLLNYSKNSVSAHDLDDGFSMVADILFTQMGLQFSSMLLSLLTIMLAAGSIASELENGMVHAIISRPIRRSSYVLGRYMGLCILSVIYASVLFMAILFIGALFSLQTITALTASQVISAWFLYTLIPVCLLCVTLYGSTALKTVPNGLLIIFLYILGNIGGMVEMIGNYVNNAAVISAGIFISLLSPFHTLYNEAQRALMPANGIAGDMMRTMGGLSGGGKAVSGWMFVYIGVYAVGLLALAIRRFSKKDI